MLDALQQRAAANAMARLAGLLDAIEISAKAVTLEENGESGARRTIASHMKYTTNTITKLAAMRALPDDCIALELPVGTYWVAILHHKEAGDAIAFLKQQAIPEQMSPAEAKQALGVVAVRESRLAKLEAELERWRALVPDGRLLERLVEYISHPRPKIAREALALAARIREAQNDGT